MLSSLMYCYNFAVALAVTNEKLLAKWLQLREFSTMFYPTKFCSTYLLRSTCVADSELMSKVPGRDK